MDPWVKIRAVRSNAAAIEARVEVLGMHVSRLSLTLESLSLPWVGLTFEIEA